MAIFCNREIIGAIKDMKFPGTKSEITAYTNNKDMS